MSTRRECEVWAAVDAAVDALLTHAKQHPTLHFAALLFLVGQPGPLAPLLLLSHARTVQQILTKVQRLACLVADREDGA